MTPALHALLDRLIDYAGLFPPADLSLGPALSTYARDLAGPDAWMLGPFITPVSRLDAIDDHLGAFGAGPVAFSVLAGGGESHADAWRQSLVETVETAKGWERRQDGAVRADAFEARVPAELATDPDALGDALDAFIGVARRYQGQARLAVEPPFLAHPETVGPTAQAVADANGRAERPAVVMKLRCGGVTPDLVPTVEALAAAIDAARRAGAPFKATAGLHHPLPNEDEAVGARMFGFLGVFGGAALARLHGLRADDLAEILDDGDAASWSIDDGLRWRSLRATAAEVADARTQFALSFGSCSFAEPRDDLRALGWL